MASETLDKQQADSELKEAIFSLRKFFYRHFYCDVPIPENKINKHASFLENFLKFREKV